MISDIVELYYQPNLRKESGADFDLDQIAFLRHLALLVANVSGSVNVPESVAISFNVRVFLTNSHKLDVFT